MGIFSWILLGLIAGALAKFIMPGKDPGGIIVTILIGIAGAIVGGFLGSFIGLGKVESFDLGGIFIATIGAIILLIVYRLGFHSRSIAPKCSRKNSRKTRTFGEEFSREGYTGWSSTGSGSQSGKRRTRRPCSTSTRAVD